MDGSDHLDTKQRVSSRYAMRGIDCIHSSAILTMGSGIQRGAVGVGGI